jgi:hypothetical protein
MNFNKILLKFFRLHIRSRFKKPWTTNARRPEWNFVKKKLTSTGKGGAPFNGRGYMSFEIRKSWPLEGGRMYRSHGPLLITVNI